MNLPEELKNSAEQLGRALRAGEVVQAFLVAQDQVSANPEASTLEQHLIHLYDDLIARQHKGEAIQQEELDGFYQLRSQVYAHPVIIEREDALSQVKPLFVEAAGIISQQIGLDYTKLAKE